MKSLGMNSLISPSRALRNPRRWLGVLAAFLALGFTSHAVEVGVAQIDITPQSPIRLVGFSTPARSGEISDVALPLRARAMAIGADQAQPVLLVVVDLIGVSDAMRNELARRLTGSLPGFDAARFTLAATHNHSGPDLPGVLPYIFEDLPTPEQADHIATYAAWLLDQLESVARSAWSNRRSAELSFAQGSADFAANRRMLKEGVWTGFGDYQDGPVDHDLPTMIVRDPDGSLRALWLNYACHAVHWREPSVHGDWPGQLAAELNSRHPGTVTMVTAGCGADQRPNREFREQPQAGVERAADEVDRLLASPGRSLTSVPVVRYRLLNLPLESPGNLADWTAPEDRYRGVLEQQIEKGRTPATQLPYLVQTWTFDEDLAVVFLAGEVVVDYVRRLKQKLIADHLWVTAYANDLPAYIPSARMLAEGGYEVDRSRAFYGVPGRVAPAAEDMIIETVHDLLPAAFLADPEAAAAAKGDEWWKHNGHARGAWWKNNKNYRGDEAQELWERVERPAAPVRTPEEALQTFKVPDGFRLELVAAEPLVTRPVFMRFDEAGRLWAVEMNGYMRDVDASGEEDPSGRVVVLEDTDGDGRMDKSTPFMENLVMPRTLAFVPGGVLVVEPPRIWFAEDLDGDLQADKRTLVADDYGNDDSPEHSANGLLPAMDNWMYSAKSAVRYRFADRQLVAEPTVFRGQWGLTQDDGGRLFYNYNASPLHTDLVPGQYLANGEAATRPPRPNGTTPPLVNVSVADDFTVRSQHVTPLITLGATDLNDDGTLKKYTAACGPLIYRGDLFPVAYRGNAFICEPVGNLVGRFALQGGADALAARAVREDDLEFLVSTDERFRPVHLETGPDGALYIADMYTGIIEHRMFVTEYLRGQTIERGFNQFTATGRIYRLVPEDNTTPRPVVLDGRSAEQLVPMLAHPNGWVRDTAQRLLVSRNDRSVLSALRHLVVQHADPLARLHAWWTMDGLGGVDETMLLAALADPDPLLRAAALRVGETWLGPDGNAGGDLVQAYRKMAHDAEFDVRLQAMVSFGQVEQPWVLAEIADLLARAKSPLLGSAAVVALRGREVPFLELVVNRADWEELSAWSGVLNLLAQAVGQRDSTSELVALAELKASPGDWRIAAIGTGVESGSPRKPVASAPELKPEEAHLFKIGESRYAQICVACHQVDGQGLTNVAPALAGSRRANASPEAAIRIVLHGLQGDLSMAGFGSIPGLMDDESIAGVLTYVRRSWGNAATPITPKQVAVVKAATAGRSQPWTEAELETWINPE